jgi:hypothetical protein
VEGSDLVGGLQNHDFLSPRDTDPSAVVATEEAEGEAGRRRALHEADPAVGLRLSAFCREQFGAAAAAHGPAFGAALAALDPALGAQLRAMLDSA